MANRKKEVLSRVEVANPDRVTFVDYTVYGFAGREKKVVGSVNDFALTDGLKNRFSDECAKQGKPCSGFQIIERDFDSERNPQMIENEVK